jgi:hypothetical protein
LTAAVAAWLGALVLREVTQEPPVGG